MKQNKRVLFFIHEYAPLFSGHGIYLRALFPYLIKKGYSIELLTLDYGHLPKTDYIDNIKVNRIPYQPNAKFHEMKMALRILLFLWSNRHKYDYFQFSGHVDEYCLLTLFCKLFNKKIIMQMVLLGADDPKSISTAYRFMNVRFKVLRKIDAFMVISKAIEESCYELKFDVNKVTKVRQGVDTQRFSPVSTQEKQALRRDFGLDEDAQYVLFVGAILERKGVDILLEAWPKVMANNPKAKLLLVGPNEFETQEFSIFAEKMQALASEQQLSVQFQGASDQVDKYMKLADLFVLPSRKEGFGNVIIEAMACGIPPIVTYMDGVALESVEDNRTGLIVHSEAELATAINRLLTHPEDRATMGQAALKHAINKFSFNEVVKDFTDIYEELDTPGSNLATYSKKIVSSNSLKALSKNIVLYSGILPAMRYIKRSQPIILMYHRILNRPESGAIQPGVFKQQMQYLMQNYNVISIDELLERLNNNTVEPYSVAITFDDGYGDFYHKAWPILRQLQLPASLYITTGFIDGKQWLWPDILRYLLNNTHKSIISHPILGEIRLGKHEIQTAWSRIADILLPLSTTERDSIFQHLFAQLEVIPPEQPTNDYRPLTWRNLQDMSEQGLDIGSHTITHPVLSNLDDQDIERELLLSMHRIEEQIGKRPNGICYPNGRSEDINNTVLSIAKETNYQYGVLAINRSIDKSRKFELGRIPAPDSLKQFKLLLARAGTQ
ncbi:glycosyltransferase [Oceanicoccus sagamiensis]|uniref:NodB homology domain-containing protein n=1 Tax=Oceanicoccus sagamiensis TaxID=716816 RepID=A0A1X9NBI0_9GAMM|nr:glycosyltransferase [Oceanicoccus sagamiensis]ARN74521.1 hypothetical protein BST96_10555 [Oceanicoccus sagamiensis]